MSTVQVIGGRAVIGDTLVCNIDGVPYTVTRNHPRYLKLKAAFNAKDAVEFLKNYDIKKAVESVVSSTGNKVEIVGDAVLYGGQPVHNLVAQHILKMVAEGFDVKPMVNFLERLMLNPSKRSVEELWGFLQACGLTLTEDGCFLAYKSVSSDYLDKHSRSVSNKVGQKPRMPRNNVDDDFRNHCSAGYHVGAVEYAGPNGYFHGSGDHVMICKVAPEDVVSVPSDHSCQKLRTCAYEVVGEYVVKMERPVYSGNVGDVYDNSDYQKEENEDVDFATAWDLFVDDVVSFDYHGERRFGVVSSIDEDRELVVMFMTGDDRSAGGVRSFHMSNMYEIASM